MVWDGEIVAIQFWDQDACLGAEAAGNSAEQGVVVRILLAEDVYELVSRNVDALLLGVSFVTRDRILLNTIHIARPGRSTRSALAKGLSISTDQVPASR